MNQYVICFAHREPDYITQDVLMIEKRKPAWQYGLLNLPGGKIEEGETPEAAAIRELREETGLFAITEGVRVLGTLEGPGYHVSACFCPYSSGQRPLKLTAERLWLVPLLDVPYYTRIIPNLRVIIPLMATRTGGWCLRGDEGDKAELSWTLSMKKAA